MTSIEWSPWIWRCEDLCEWNVLLIQLVRLPPSESRGCQCVARLTVYFFNQIIWNESENKKTGDKNMSMFISSLIVCWIRLHRSSTCLADRACSLVLWGISSLHPNRFCTLSRSCLRRQNRSRERNRDSLIQSINRQKLAGDVLNLFSILNRLHYDYTIRTRERERDKFSFEGFLSSEGRQTTKVPVITACVCVSYIFNGQRS